MSSQTPYLSENPDQPITEAVPFFRELGCPRGFSPILTKDVKEGQEVYLMGSIIEVDQQIKPHAYGPHTIIPNQSHHSRAWLENSKGRRFRVNQEELLIKHHPSKNTPWGAPNSTTEKFPGAWWHSTPSHGGIELSPDNQVRFQKLFPTTEPFEGLQWLEEDQDAYLGVLLLPTAFSPNDVAEALLSLKGRREYKGPETFATYLNSPIGAQALQINEIHQKATAHLWKKGSWSTAHPKEGIHMWVTHQSTQTRKQVYYDGPDQFGKDYFTSEELELKDPSEI